MPRLLLTVLAFLALVFVPPAQAQISAANSDVPDFMSIVAGPLIPGNPVGRYLVTIRDTASNPVGGAHVTIQLNPGAIPLIAWCGGVPPPPASLTGVTNAVGQIEFNLSGGGCIFNQPCAVPPATVFVDGAPPVEGSFSKPIQVINSPDIVSDQGVPADCPAITTCFLGLTRCGLSDAVIHTPCVKGGLICPCTKFLPPFGAPVGLGDAVLLTPFIKAGNLCGC